MIIHNIDHEACSRICDHTCINLMTSKMSTDSIEITVKVITLKMSNDLTLKICVIDLLPKMSNYLVLKIHVNDLLQK